MTHVDTPQSVCQFAIARGDITPPAGIYHRMWGAAAHDRAEGVHRPLTATVAIFQATNAEPSPEIRQVVIALDHCVMGRAEIDLLLEAVCQTPGLDRESVLVVFSHTHAAGLMLLDRKDLPGGDLIAGYLADVAARLAELAATASQNLQPATISYGTARCDMAGHRDFWDQQSGQFVCGFNPSGKGDDTVLVARVSGAGDQTLATVVNYACHPTTLAWDNRLVSPDFPGAMREVVEDATGAPCLFIQGASGDLGPKDGYVGDVEVADRNGRQLGYAALSTLASLPAAGTRFQYVGPVVSGATIGAWSHVPLPPERRERLAQWRLRRWAIEIDYRPELPSREEAEAEHARWLADEQAALDAGQTERAQDCRAMVERQRRLLARLAALPEGRSYPLQIVLWRMGGAVWVVVQGEPYNLLQRSLRERFAGLPIVVATVANNWGPSYLPPAELYGKGIYQESIAVLAAGCLERLIDQIGEQIAVLAPEANPSAAR